MRANGKKERLVEAESVVFLQGTKFRDRERDEARLTPGTTLVARVIYQRRVHAKGGGEREKKKKKNSPHPEKACTSGCVTCSEVGVPFLRHEHNPLITALSPVST